MKCGQSRGKSKVERMEGEESRVDFGVECGEWRVECAWSGVLVESDKCRAETGWNEEWRLGSGDWRVDSERWLRRVF